MKLHQSTKARKVIMFSKFAAKTAFIFAMLFCSISSYAQINVNEFADGFEFPNSTAGNTVYTLEAGVNTFAGALTSLADEADYFQVRVPFKHRITNIQIVSSVLTSTNHALGGISESLPLGEDMVIRPVDLGEGIYQVSNIVDILVGFQSWSMELTVDAPPVIDNELLTATDWTNIVFSYPDPRIRSTAVARLPKIEDGAIAVEFEFTGGDGGKAEIQTLSANGGQGALGHFTLPISEGTEG